MLDLVIWNSVNCFISNSRIVRSYGEVTIAVLQNTLHRLLLVLSILKKGLFLCHCCGRDLGFCFLRWKVISLSCFLRQGSDTNVPLKRKRGIVHVRINDNIDTHIENKNFNILQLKNKSFTWKCQLHCWNCNDMFALILYIVLFKEMCISTHWSNNFF